MIVSQLYRLHLVAVTPGDGLLVVCHNYWGRNFISLRYHCAVSREPTWYVIPLSLGGYFLLPIYTGELSEARSGTLRLCAPRCFNGAASSTFPPFGLRGCFRLGAEGPGGEGGRRGWRGEGGGAQRDQFTALGDILASLALFSSGQDSLDTFLLPWWLLCASCVPAVVLGAALWPRTDGPACGTRACRGSQ